MIIESRGRRWIQWTQSRISAKTTKKSFLKAGPCAICLRSSLLFLTFQRKKQPSSHWISRQLKPNYRGIARLKSAAKDAKDQRDVKDSKLLNVLLVFDVL